MRPIFLILCYPPIGWGTAVLQWLRYWATNRKVAGSIPDDVNGIFHWHNPSDRTMARGQLSVWQKWVPRVFPGGKGNRCVGFTNLPPSYAVVMKSGNLNFLEPSGLLQACNGTDLPFTNWLQYHRASLQYGWMYYSLSLQSSSLPTVFSQFWTTACVSTRYKLDSPICSHRNKTFRSATSLVWLYTTRFFFFFFFFLITKRMVFFVFFYTPRFFFFFFFLKTHPVTIWQCEVRAVGWTTRGRCNCNNRTIIVSNSESLWNVDVVKEWFIFFWVITCTYWQSSTFRRNQSLSPVYNSQLNILLVKR